ncbi:protein DBF4 homolog A isoform X1 [Cottoperca gobio]|uniref:Protein DBF4 homolog A n=1 Tax=Cottoperca gobio TaxID=56716 RepID=A0A6J2RAT5_COTGO|nr:protein DBF4 homolog A isoform X1 [Cottoperca gobio]XP_029307221.1 protein DBF4 homolog A isoform X1 [Cottoperca gobio]
MKENKMKPKRTQRQTGPNWQGRGLSTAGDKATLSQAKPTRVSSLAQIKPLAGKVFYLDLPSNRLAETLESNIKDLGGSVEKFFSKEIRYLVSNKREARYVHCLRQESPVPNPDSGPSSPHPRSNQHQPGSNIKSKSQGQTDTFVPSRGKSLVERVVKEQERVKINKILSNALEWGVKIVYIDDILAYIKKRKKRVSSQCPAVKRSVKAESAAKQGFQKCKGGRISKPFVKVEDSSRHYRPICLTMPNMPEVNLKTVAPCSPFCVDDKGTPGNKQPGHRGAKASGSEERANGRKKNRDKKQGGYCECCMIKYENVTAHLKSERHKAFSKSDEYLVVDKLVSTLHCNFIQIKLRLKDQSAVFPLFSPFLHPVGKLCKDTREISIPQRLLKKSSTGLLMGTRNLIQDTQRSAQLLNLLL